MKYHTTILIAAATFIMAGCDKSTPPKKDVEKVIEKDTPGCSVSITDIEGIPSKLDESVSTVNFKATIVTTEDFYQTNMPRMTNADMVRSSSPFAWNSPSRMTQEEEAYEASRIVLYTVKTPKGKSISTYGSVEAKRTLDQWEFHRPKIEADTSFGVQKKNFGPNDFIDGTAEAKDAIEKFEAAEKAKDEAKLKAEAPIAIHVSEGKIYIGTIYYKNPFGGAVQSQEFAIKFQKAERGKVKATIYNPKNPKNDTREIDGIINFNAKENQATYQLENKGRIDNDSECWDIYKKPMQLLLKASNGKLIGNGSANDGYGFDKSYTVSLPLAQ